MTLAIHWRKRGLCNYLLWLIAIIFILTGGCCTNHPYGVSGKLIRSFTNRATNEIIDNDWIIIFREDRLIDISQKLDSIFENIGSIRRRIIVRHSFEGLLQGIALRLPKLDHDTRWSILYKFANDEDVEYIEQDQLLRIPDLHEEYIVGGSQHEVIPNNNTHESNTITGQSEGARGTEIQVWPPWGLDRIDKAYEAMDLLYKYKYDGDGVDIYIIDSGVAQNIDDLDNRVSCELNLVDDEDCSDSRDHGTKVAAVAAGWSFGVAKYANIKSIKIIDKRGNGRASNALKAFEYIFKAMQKNPKKRIVVNMSLGVERISPSFEKIIEKAVEAGIVVVVASGNEDLDACTTSPASSLVAITVAASDIEDKVWGSSNWGNCVDIVAPGVNILTANAAGYGATSYVTGTSIATPFVSGVAALLLQAYPDATPDEIRARMIAGAAVGVLSDSTNYPNLLLSTEYIDTPLPAPESIPSPSPTTNPLNPNNPPDFTSSPTNEIVYGCGVIFLSKCRDNDDCCSDACFDFRLFGKRCWFKSNLD